jgi:endo-1,4-beta-xylanase
MVSPSALLLAATAFASVFSLPENNPRRIGTASSSTTHNGYDIASPLLPTSRSRRRGRLYYQFWSDGSGTVAYTNGAVGWYSVQWSDVSDFTAGKG